MSTYDIHQICRFQLHVPAMGLRRQRLMLTSFWRAQEEEAVTTPTSRAVSVMCVEISWGQCILDLYVILWWTMTCMFVMDYELCLWWRPFMLWMMINVNYMFEWTIFLWSVSYNWSVSYLCDLWAICLYVCDLDNNRKEVEGLGGHEVFRGPMHTDEIWGATSISWARNPHEK